MDRVTSNWKVTFDPASTALLIVDIGQFVDGDLRLTWNNNVQGSLPVGAAGASYLNRNQTTRDFIIGVYKEHASFAAASNYLLQLQVDLPTFPNAPLKIEVDGGNTFQVANVALSAGDSMIVRKVPTFRTWVQWRFKGGAITKL